MSEYLSDVGSANAGASATSKAVGPASEGHIQTSRPLLVAVIVIFVGAALFCIGSVLQFERAQLNGEK